ncbi:nucleolar complex-associated protein 2 [Aristolochia californica]|uniref:nucleolar complex-associated protein 2 n=1 Tax=Aristolochia californica TaxID=171875 RepID=UPI0035DB0759
MLEDMDQGSKQKAKEHMQQLQRLQEKDPEFYEFLKEQDKELLDFNDEDIPDDSEAELDEMKSEDMAEDVEKASTNIITTAMVDSWCNSIQQNRSVGAVRSLMRAFRTACHYGDDGEKTKFNVISSSVFNKIMLFVLNEMDGVLRDLLKLPSSGGKKETVIDLMTTKAWKNYGSLVKSYLGNSLHVLNQMTDNQMISFTLRRLRYSVIFLAAFQNLLRKYIKVALHFWGTGGGALPVVSFLFIRDLCIRLGSDCLDACLKGVYKSYILNCQFVNASKLQHIQFLANCVSELYGVDHAYAYQHAFVFIRQLGMILRDALTVKTKESFRKVYEWKFMNCLELWTAVLCAYSSEADFKPLAYPLTQIISGVARLVPTAKYFPLRLRCARMLNRIAAATGTFIPVSMLLLDMLEMKELNRPPTGGVGKAVDLRTTLKVSKPTLKTRGFQEACVFSVVEELTEHLAQWSYSVAFFELSFIPLVRLRNFCKSTKVERFGKLIKALVRQIEASLEFANTRRMTIKFLPNDPALASFLEVEKEAKDSPLSQYVATLHAEGQRRNDSMAESSIVVGKDSAIFTKKISGINEENVVENTDEGVAIFNSSWLPGSKPKSSDGKKTKHSKKSKPDITADEDFVEDLVLSSDDEGEEEQSLNSVSAMQGKVVKHTTAKQGDNGKKRTPPRRRHASAKKPKKMGK